MRGLNMHASARLLYDVPYNPLRGFEEIDGSPIIKEWDDGVAETDDGRMWFWFDQSFRDEPATPVQEAGEWKEWV